jgi:acyl carrier protein
MSGEHAEVIHFLEDYFRERYSDDITADTDLIETGLLESLMILDLNAHIEQRYEICFEPEEVAPRNFRSVRTLAALITRKHDSATTGQLH